MRSNTHLKKADGEKPCPKHGPFSKQKKMDNGKLIESSGSVFFAYPNLSVGPHDLFNSQLAQKLILSRIFSN